MVEKLLVARYMKDILHLKKQCIGSYVSIQKILVKKTNF